MHCHLLNKLFCCLQGQGHNEGAYNQNMFVSTISSELLIFFTTKLIFMVHNFKLECPVKKLQGQGHSNGSKLHWMFVSSISSVNDNDILGTKLGMFITDYYVEKCTVIKIHRVTNLFSPSMFRIKLNCCWDGLHKFCSWKVKMIMFLAQSMVRMVLGPSAIMGCSIFHSRVNHWPRYGFPVWPLTKRWFQLAPASQFNVCLNDYVQRSAPW